MARLLLVDDDPHIGLIVSVLSQRSGHELTVAPDVASAWPVLAGRPTPSGLSSVGFSSPPDLTLVDVNLGGETGLSLCRRVRAHPEAGGVKLALFTHWGMPQDIAAGLDAGVDFLLAKDLVSQPAQWAHRVREILAGCNGNAPPGLLGSHEESSREVPLREWADRINSAVDSAWPLGSATEVSTTIFRRALAKTEGSGPIPRDPRAPSTPGAGSFLLIDRGRLVPAGHLEAARGGLVQGTVVVQGQEVPPINLVNPQVWATSLLTNLAEDLWRLVGLEASQKPRAALARLVAGPILPSRG